MGPHGSPGNTKYCPVVACHLCRRSLTASRALGLLGRSLLLTMRICYRTLRSNRLLQPWIRMCRSRISPRAR